MVVNNYAMSPAESLGYFSGIARSWQTDKKGVRVKRGAFAKAIADAQVKRDRRNGEVLWPVLVGHKPEEAVGFITSARETDQGLYVEGYLDRTIKAGEEAYQKARKGYASALSVTFIPEKEHSEGSTRVIDLADMIEVSLDVIPLDEHARITEIKSKSFNDTEQAVLRAIAQERESKMGSIRYIDDNEAYERPLRDSRSYSPYEEAPAAPYRIEPGKHPEESRTEFERALRRELRESDPDLYSLAPGGKAFSREVEKRRQERNQKQLAQKAALEAERREIAERQAAMNAETFTPESFAAASGLGAEWSKRWFYTLVNSGRAVPIDENGLVLRAQDVRAAAKRDAELIELEAIRARNKRAEREAA